MKERAVSFDARQVRATLNGTMTQFRRLIRSRQPKPGHQWNECLCGEIDPADRPCLTCSVRYGLGEEPKYKVGDRLWVRETWAMSQKLLQGDAHPWHRHVIWAASHGARPDTSQGWEDRWRPSIHMPRWASRLTLEVTEVRVQRLQDISEDDARAEGIQEHPAARPIVDSGMWTHRAAFRAVWDFLDPGGWDRNPWVWPVTFKRVQG